MTSDVTGPISGGSGFADSYYLPFILGWNGKRAAVRGMYGFLAPTGSFVEAANDNVGSGYWTHASSSGQTFYLTENRRLVLSTFEMYEFHTTQNGTGVHPGDTFDLDYSLMGSLPPAGRPCGFRAGLAGYRRAADDGEDRTERHRGRVRGTLCRQLARVRAIGRLSQSTGRALGLKYFKEFANRSTFEGYSFQVYGAISF